METQKRVLINVIIIGIEWETARYHIYAINNELCLIDFVINENNPIDCVRSFYDSNINLSSSWIIRHTNIASAKFVNSLNAFVLTYYAVLPITTTFKSGKWTPIEEVNISEFKEEVKLAISRL